jgi:hypothetical protein
MPDAQSGMKGYVFLSQSQRQTAPANRRRQSPQRDGFANGHVVMMKPSRIIRHE